MTISVNDIGLTELVRDGGCSALRINIIFVHGLKGHPKRTWTASPELNPSLASRNRASLKSFLRQKRTDREVGSDANIDNPASAKVFWPEDYLVEDIPEARIWTYGYNANVSGGLFEANNKNSISQHGRDLAVRLERDIENQDPIFFVAHSLGGILVKDAIRRSETCRSRTRLIVFLGTPHRGSEFSGWGQIAANLARLVRHDVNSRIVTALDVSSVNIEKSVNSEVLDNIHEEFKTIAHTQNLQIHSFQEARGISWVSGLENKIIDDSSSKVDLPRALETVETIDADHRQMVKCNSRADARYLAILKVLKQHLRKTKSIELPFRKCSFSRQAGVAREPEEVPAANVAPLRPNTKFIVPYNRNNEFIGRSSLLADMEQQLQLTETKSAGKARSRVALYGLGGVGKTQTVLAYIYQLRETSPNVSIFWVHASSPGRFLQSYFDIARECNIADYDSPKVDVRTLVKEWLSNTDRSRWLMVLDNADNTKLFDSAEEENLVRYIPECSHGSILVTSRNKQAALKLAQGKGCIEVGKLEEDEASNLVRSLLEDSQVSNDEILLLSARLEYLPLALVQALAFIQENSIPLSAYIELLDTEFSLVDRLSEPFETVGRDSETPHAVTATWIISFEQIRQQNSFASDLLSFLCLFDREAIPMEYLRSYYKKVLPGHTEAKEKLELIKALGTLKAFCFISEVKDTNLDMHRLVQLVARKWLLSQKRWSETADQVLWTVAFIFEQKDLQSRESCSKNLPHIYTALSHPETESHDGKISRGSANHNLGVHLFHQGHYAEAERHINEAIKLREEVFDRDHAFTLSSRANLAMVYEFQWRLKEAERLHQQVLDVRLRLLGEENHETLISMSNLAINLEHQDQLADAEKLNKRVLSIRKRALGDDHLRTIHSMGNLSIIYAKQGRQADAVELDRRVVEARTRLLGHEHPETLKAKNNLMVSLATQHEHAEVAKFRQLWEVMSRVMGERHPLTLQTMKNTAWMLATESPTEAEELAWRAFEGRRAVLGENHHDTLASMSQLATNWHVQGRVADAMALLEDCTTRSRRVLGQEHKVTRLYLEQLDQWKRQPETT